MNEKIHIYFCFVNFFFILFFSLNLFTSQNCKTLKIFKVAISLETKQLNNCISKNFFRTNVHNFLKDRPYLFSIARAIKRKYITPRYILDNIANKQDQIDKNLVDDLNIEKPFIKGLVNKEYSAKILNRKLKSNNYEEYNTWFRSHGGNWNTKYDNGKNINKDNISRLKLLWKYSSIKKLDSNLNKNKYLKKKWKQNIQLNPVFINGKLIFVTADWKVVAVNVVTGKLIWELQSIFPPSRRGILVTHDEKLDLDVLYINMGSRIYKININNGKKIKDFGENGSIEAASLVAPMIYKNNLVVVTLSKSVFVFDSNSGKFISSIPIYEKRNFLGGLPWGGVAIDNKKGIVFINTGNPRPALYGVKRKGNNERSSSIVAVDLNEKKVKWDFQETAHDLWDFDIPSPPILHELEINGKIYEVVISVTKTGNTLILERNTGQPIFDVTYKKAPKSDVPGEITSPFQIDIKKPEKFSKIEFNLDDINKLTESKQTEIKKKLKNAKYGWYEPPSFNHDVIMYGIHGGAEWSGAAIDPINQYLYIPANNYPWKLRPYMISIELKTYFNKEMKNYYKFYIDKCSTCHGKKRNGINIKEGEKEIKFIPSLVGLNIIPNLNKKISIKNINNKHKDLKLTSNEVLKITKLFNWWDEKLEKNNEIRVKSNYDAWSQFLTEDGLPASNPPWGYIAKLDLVSGKILWKSPVGYLKMNGEKIKIGTPNFGGLALNGAGLLFFTGTEDSLAYAIDSKTGEEKWSYKMDAAGSAPPIIFNYNGKQYISFVSTGGRYHNFKNKASSIYTFGIVE